MIHRIVIGMNQPRLRAPGWYGGIGAVFIGHGGEAVAGYLTEAMIDDLYNQQILGAAAGISRVGRLTAPQGSATKESRLCGSQITVDVEMSDNVVSDYAQEIKACVLGQAAASLLAERVIGCNRQELAAAREALRAMLKEGAEGPDGTWHPLRMLAAARAYPMRHGSILLAFDATLAALDTIKVIPGQRGAQAAG